MLNPCAVTFFFGNRSEDATDSTVVIKMLPEKAGESRDESITKGNVEAMIRDGLRLRDIRVKKGERKQNKRPTNKNPGIVKVVFETKEQNEKKGRRRKRS